MSAGRFVVSALGMVGFLSGVAVAQEDVEGSADHPLLGRFSGAAITYYRAIELDEAALLQAPHDYYALLQANALGDHSGANWLQVEGRVTQIRYDIPEGHSSLEVQRNYDAALRAAGFVEQFACTDEACFTGNLATPTCSAR